MTINQCFKYLDKKVFWVQAFSDYVDIEEKEVAYVAKDHVLLYNLTRNCRINPKCLFKKYEDIPLKYRKIYETKDTSYRTVR